MLLDVKSRERYLVASPGLVHLVHCRLKKKIIDQNGTSPNTSTRV